VSDTAPAPADLVPDWSTLGRELTCPLCDYNLRGLSEPRCPECGFKFQWRELLDTSKHPYLFEHHRHRRAWSFFRTLSGGLLPRRFWRKLRPSHEINRRRLIQYWMLAVGLLIFLPILLFATVTWRSVWAIQAQRQAQVVFLQANANNPFVKQAIARAGSIQAFVDNLYPAAFSRRFFAEVWSLFWNGGNYGVPRNWALSPFGFMWLGRFHGIGFVVPTLVTLLLWPWVTFLTLMIFLVSMHKAHVRPLHVLRCAIYSSDAAWLAVFLIPFLGEEMPVPSRIHLELAIGHGRMMQLMVAVLFALLVSYRLAAAYRLYLRFPHAISVAITSQFIVLLIVLIAALNL
jgi:hypothetical protein